MEKFIEQTDKYLEDLTQWIEEYKKKMKKEGY